MSPSKDHIDSAKRIVELEKKVDSLSKEKEDYRTLFDSILFGVQEIDTKGIIIYANRAHHEIHGYDEGELTGRSILELSPTEEKKAELAAYLDFLVKEQPAPIAWVDTDRRKDGALIDVRIDWNYKRDQDGSVVGFISLITDISAHKEAEKEISIRKAEFEAIFNSITDAVVFVDKQRKIMMINNAFTEMLGYEQEEAIGRTTQFFYADPDDYLKQGEKRYHVGAQAKSPVYEIDYRRKDGTVFTSETLGTAVNDETGQTIGFLGVMRDISKRKKAEQALKESEEKYSKLFNSEADAIAIFDAETRELTDCNNALLKLYGYSREEALQLKADDLSAEPEKTVASINKEDTRVSRRRHKKKNGSEIIVNISAGSMVLGGRTVMFARILDITDHVEAEDALHESEERFRSAFQTSPDSININRLDGTYVEINEGFTELTGYTRKDVIGHSSIDINIWNDLEDRKTLVEGLQKSGRVENLEAKFRMKDGSIKTGLMSASIIKLHGEPHILSITRDITARKKAEEAKAKLEAQLRQVYKMEAIGTMAGGIAHDFNNILTIILGNADLARFIIKDEGPTKGYIDHIIEASGRAKEMVRQILAFSRTAQQDLIAVKPHMVFFETLNLLRSTIPSTVEIRQDLDAECHNIKADPTQLNQVLINLAANAVHAMDEKGLLDVSLQNVELDEEETRYKKLLTPGSYVMLTVTDSGQGMSSEVLERVFDPFFTTKKVGEGTGMGLSVVHGIVESHGGMITAESSPGKGATFRLYFPAIDETVQQVSKKSPIHYQGSERILFVDDEKSLVEIGAEMLRVLGYKVTAKTGSLDALAAFKADPDSFDVVITDQTMPDMSGAELAAELLKIRPGLPIILCTGYSSKISDEMTKEIGLADFFLKPFDTEKLATIVRKVLDRA